MATTEDPSTKAARNQALFREVNERIQELTAHGAPASEELELLCECSDETCITTVGLTLAEYEEIRRVPTHFPVKPGHVNSQVERVVEETERYNVVEKIGEAGRFAIMSDPRRRDSAGPQ